MALPKNDLPLYKLTLPSNGKELTYRQFTSKEEKILLIAKKEDSEQNILLAIKQICNNCIQEELDVDSLAPFDLEWIFLQLRIKSTGQRIHLEFEGRSEESTKCEECRKPRKITVDLNDVKIKKGEHSTNIDLGNGTGLSMKYPTMKMLESIPEAENNMDYLISLIIECTDFIYDETTQYPIKDEKPEDVREWFESLTTQQTEKIKTFFEGMPTMTYDLDLSCSKCDYKQVYTLEGLQDFFG